MHEYAQAILDLSKDCTIEFVTGSRSLTDKPCWIFSVIPDIGPGDKIAQVTLRNGETPISDILVVLYGEYSCPIFQGSLPLYFNRGLYVAVEQDTAGVTIQYLPGYKP